MKDRLMTNREDLLRIALTEAAERLVVEPKPFIVLFKRGDFSVELFAPRGTDTQQPHDQDEAYIVVSGSGMFRRGEERAPFQQGDFLFVAAGVPHRFEEFTMTFRPGCCSSGRRAASVVNVETNKETEARLLGVISKADFEVLDGDYVV